MESLKLLGLIFIRPGYAFSEVMDRGNWLVAAGLSLLVAIAFFATVNAKLEAAYRVPAFEDFYTYDPSEDESGLAGKRRFNEAIAKYNEAMAERAIVPIVGDRFFSFFSFQPTAFYRPAMAISIFQVPLMILLVSLFSGIASFGLLLRRDYAVLGTCSLLAWTAGHLPFAVAGVALMGSDVSPVVWFAMWIASGLLFGFFLVFALRTVFGVGFGVAAAAAALSWPAFTIAMYIFTYVSPWLLSPFILFWIVIYFGGALGGEVRGFGNAFRQRQNLKRFLQNATINPRDADAHVQLGLIYQDRRQEARAFEHFSKALAIDADEIDANFELGKYYRRHAELQKALDHFSTVLGQDDKFRLSEIWREIGATYLEAGMLDEAENALEKFVERRNVDPEGLYYYGKVLKAKGENDRAREMFESAVESARTSPYFRSRQLGQWVKLSQKEL